MIDITLACLSGSAVALAWLFGSPRLAEPLYRTAIFEAHKFPLGDWSLDWLKDYSYEEITFPSSDGDKLNGILIAHENARATIIVNHGNTGNVADMDVLIGLLLQCDANVFIYDYRGFGKSESIESVDHACEDAVAAYDYVAKRLPEAPIIIYGESIGGGFSCYLAQRRKIAGLIMQSCFAEFKTIACEHYAIFKIWPKLLFPWPYMNNATVLHNKLFPVLIFHGKNDKEVDPRHAQVLYDAAIEPKQLVILGNTEHEEIDPMDAPIFLCHIRQFLDVACPPYTIKLPVENPAESPIPALSEK